MTLPQARQLMECSFPRPKNQPAYIMRVVDYYTQRNDQAYRSHRKRRMNELNKWKSI